MGSPISVPTLREFLAAAQKLAAENDFLLDQPLSVICSNPAVGAKCVTPIKAIAPGFDWDAGRILVYLEDGVLMLPKSEKGPHWSYEDVLVTESTQPVNAGTSLVVAHAGGYIGAHLRTKISSGDKLRIIRLGPAKHHRKENPA